MDVVKRLYFAKENYAQRRRIVTYACFPMYICQYFVSQSQTIFF